MEDASSRGRPLTRVERTVLAVVVAVAATYWAICSLLVHRGFHSNGWDLGLIHQVLWNSSYGRVFEYSFRDISYAGDHWQPFLLLLLPIEWVFHDAEALLVVQAIALAAAVVPLYAAARRLGLWHYIGAAFVAAYVLSLAVAQAVSFDFHVEVFAPLLAFTAMWALASQHRWLFVAMVVGILTLKEDGALLAIALCWVGWFAYHERSAIPMAAVAILYMFIATAVIIPHYRGDDQNPFTERYGYLGDSPLGVVWGVLTKPGLVFEQLTRPDALEAMVVVLASAAFLPLLAPRLLPVLALVTLLPLLSKEPGQGALLLHYLLVPSLVALVIAVVVARQIAQDGSTQPQPGNPLSVNGEGAGAVLSLSKAGGVRPPVLIAAALVVLPVALFAWRSPLPPSFEAEMARFEVDDHARLAQSFVDDIPPHASVSAQSTFVPHLSARAQLFQFPRLAESFYVLLDEKGPVPSEDRNAGFDDCKAALPALGYEVIRAADGITLWQRTRDPQPLDGVPERCGGRRTFTP